MPEIHETEYFRTSEYEINGHNLITVYQNRIIGDGTWGKAVVNWGAIGSVGTETGKEFAKKLLEACELADKWTAEKCNLTEANA